MKKVSALFAACLIAASAFASKREEKTGRSFMFVHPANYNVATRLHLWHAIAFNPDYAKRSGFQVTTFYQKSMPLCKNERYFLFNFKNTLHIVGDMAMPQALVSKRDVRAEWLGLPDDFLGDMSICPRQRQAGFILELYQDLGAFCQENPIPFLKDWWVSVEIPVIRVENNIGLTQANVHTAQTTFPNTIIDAFNQPKWCYAKMGPEDSKFRPAEIKFMLGSTYMHEGGFEIIYYTLLSIPTGRKPNPEFIFSPVVGNGGHVGWGGGASMQILLSRCDPDTFAWSFYIDLESTLLVRNTQHRTFDLKGKPWSRYMLYNIEGCPPTNTPGVNLLTFRVRSRPYNLVDFDMGWRFRARNFELELGFGIWGHGAERVRLTCPFKERFGIAGAGVAIDKFGNMVGATASTSNIMMLNPNDKDDDDNDVFIAVEEKDIDLCSGAAASALNYRGHVGLGSISECYNTSVIWGGGFFVEVPQKNRPLQMWGIWVKGGATF